MPQTHELGRLYCGLQYHPKFTPFRFLERAHSTESEAPYRLGTGVMLRLPFVRHGLLLGYWWGHGTEDSVDQATWEIWGDRTEEVREWATLAEGPSILHYGPDQADWKVISLAEEL